MALATCSRLSNGDHAGSMALSALLYVACLLSRAIVARCMVCKRTDTTPIQHRKKVHRVAAPYRIDGLQLAFSHEFSGATQTRMWPPVKPFVHFLAKHPVSGKHVLELGAGLGLCSVLAWQLGASEARQILGKLSNFFFYPPNKKTNNTNGTYKL